MEWWWGLERNTLRRLDRELVAGWVGENAIFCPKGGENVILGTKIESVRRTVSVKRNQRS